MEPFPLDLAWPEIAACLKTHSNLVLVAEPGAGKTTRFPPRLLASGLLEHGQTALMLEPRRLAARAAASRIADEQGWSVGGEVGYQVRFENKTSSSTRLKILTEGLLTRLLQSDPELNGVGAILLDEFHERSQHTDLALGLLFELQQLTRPDLRLIVMSATLDAERVSKFLGDCPIVRVPGRTYPVTVHHGARPLSLETGPALFDRVSERILDLVEGRAASEGDLLVFLPGTREIRGVRERVQDRAARAGYETVELHGSLSLEEQDRAIKKSRTSAFEKKIVLATNIAETSLTIDGIGTVLDSGLARVSRFDAAGFSRLQLSRISLASATQRSGRAGRQGPGLSYRLWSKIDEASMPEFEQPEILRTDLTEPLMTLLASGVREPETFSWFETPAPQSLKAALTTLDELGFRDPTTGDLTADGRLALRFPLPVRPARLVLEAARVGQARLGAEIAALLTEKDIVLRSSSGQADRSGLESDVLVRLHKLHDTNARDVDRIGKQICLKAADQIERIAKSLSLSRETWADGLSQDEIALKLVLLGYPDRICRRRRVGETQARMIGGKGVRLAPFSSVERSEFFIALDSMEPPPHATGVKNEVLISLASQIERAWVEQFFAKHLRPTSSLVFDESSRAVLEQSALCLRDLPMTEPRVKKPNPDEAHAFLVRECLDHWELWFAPLEDLKSLTERIAFLKLNGVEVSLDAEFKTQFLEEACFGSTKLDEVLNKDLGEIAKRHLSSEITTALRKEAPDRIEVPSGSLLRIQYPEGRAPFLEVRIQEIFGWTESPRLASGRVPLQLQLLGPNYRPVQVTSDLASFWRTGYPEVRKELRLRYPKHSWPEDPFTAKPEAKGRPRK